jgi:cell division protein FtsN
MTEYTDERGDRWKVLTHPRKVLDANGEEFVWTVEVEQVPTPADDWATRAAVRIWGEVVQVIQSPERGVPKVAAIIREHAPKPASEPTVVTTVDGKRRWHLQAGAWSNVTQCADARLVPVEEP